MPIVRSDKRDRAIKLVGDTRAQLREILTHANELQATIEALELELGLANEGEQAGRDQMLVLHYPKGSDTGHTLDECGDECIAQDSLEELGEGGAESEASGIEGT